MKYILTLLAFLFCGAAQAQDALVVATCGTLPLAYAPGATRLLTVDTTGKLCGTGGGGAGNPGGSNTQVQYNNAGSFGGITGATSNGTTLTLVAPVLGTPASGTLTNTTGFPAANLAGAGTGVLTAFAASLNASTGLIGALTATNGNCVVGNGAAWTSTACPGGTAANPTGTAGPTAVNGVATTYMRSDGAPAVQQGSAAQKGIVQVDGTTITAASGVISTATLTVTQRTETGTNPALPSSDQTKVVYLNNAANQIPTIAQAGTGGFTTGWFATYCNIGAGTQTITPTTSTIGGAATLLLPAGSVARPQCSNVISDGTNYTLVPQSGTVFTGTLALATSAIGSAACSSAQTVTAPGVATTDVPLLSFNADPTAVTGYVPLTAGMLTIIAYPTANTVNVKVCNNTTASITPGAITLNVKVMR